MGAEFWRLKSKTLCKGSKYYIVFEFDCVCCESVENYYNNSFVLKRKFSIKCKNLLFNSLFRINKL